MKNCNLIVIISVLLVVIVNITYYSKKSYFMILFLIKKIKDYFMKKNIFIALGFLLVSLVIFTGCEPNSNYWDDWEETGGWLKVTHERNQYYNNDDIKVTFNTEKQSEDDINVYLHKHRYTNSRIHCDYEVEKYNGETFIDFDSDEFYINKNSVEYLEEDNFYIWRDDEYVYVANSNIAKMYYYEPGYLRHGDFRFKFKFTGINELRFEMKRKNQTSSKFD